MKKPAKNTKPKIPEPKFPFFCKTRGHDIFDSGACVYPPTKDCRKCRLSNKTPNLFGTNPPSPEISRRISIKKDGRSQKKSKKRLVENFEILMITFLAYMELLRLESQGSLNEGNRRILTEIKSFLEETERELIEIFLNACVAGKSKIVSIVVAGLGANVFTKTWFSKGLAALYNQGKSIILKPLPDKEDWAKLFEDMSKVERALQRGTADEVFNKRSRITYYQTLPRKQLILYFHYVFGLPDRDQQKSFLSFYPASDDPQTLINICAEYLS
jgi:hypothetical protein